MKVRAIIFDIYGTLLEVGPPPPDAEEQWSNLWSEFLPHEPLLCRLDFSVHCNRIIATRHAHARGLEIPFPEVWWPSVLTEALPALKCLSPERLDEFVCRQVELGHTTRLSPETASLLRWLASHQLRLGIASNAQAYTVREFQEHLATNRLDIDLFDPELSFWSYQHGFSKPDPHVFQLLTARLEARGITPDAAVMVGDRLDNDVEPARRHGWQTWHCGPAAGWMDFQARFGPFIDKQQLAL